MDEQRKLIFYPEWYNLIKVQPDSLRLALYDAILSYKYDNVEPTDQSILLVFGLIKQQIDKDNSKYDEICERNRANVMKRWNKSNTTDTTEYDRIPLVPPNTVATNNNCNCNNNITIKEKPTNVGEKENAASNDATLSKVCQEFYNELIPYVEMYGKDMIREFYDYWTEPNKSKTKIRKQLERTWDTNRRLRTWANKPFRNNNNNGNTADRSNSSASASDVANLVMQALNESC